MKRWDTIITNVTSRNGLIYYRIAAFHFNRIEKMKSRCWTPACSCCWYTLFFLHIFQWLLSVSFSRHISLGNGLISFETIYIMLNMIVMNSFARAAICAHYLTWNYVEKLCPAYEHWTLWMNMSEWAYILFWKCVNNQKVRGNRKNSWTPTFFFLERKKL